MKNERRLLPLRKYSVHRILVKDGYEREEVDTFTGDNYETITADDGYASRTQFFNTGNLIREYFGPVDKIVVTPVDDEDLA